MPYSKVERHIWDDERFRAWPKNTRDTWLYLLTCRHQNRLGCFVLDPAFVAADVQMTQAEATEALAQLHREERIIWDPSVRVVLIVQHLKHNALENPNVVKAAVSELFAIPFAKPCLNGLAKGIATFCKARTKSGKPWCSTLSEAIQKRLDNDSGSKDLNRSPNGIGNGLGNRMPNPEPEPEPEPYKDTSSTPRGGALERTPLRAYLGAHEDVVGRMESSNEHGTFWQAGLFGMYGPRGTDEMVWRGTADADRAQILANAIDRFAAEGSEYKSHYFRKFLQRAIDDHRDSVTGPDRRGTAPGEAARETNSGGAATGRDFSHLGG